jgi:CRISPR/Cas system CSM-associated protein Csm2 small subunit
VRQRDSFRLVLQVLQYASRRHNYGTLASSQKLSNSAQEEEKLRKLYDQARTQGNKKKKKEYKEKIAELNRLRKTVQRESNKSKS